MNLQQATESRLLQIRDAAESGNTELTGKAQRTQEHGAAEYGRRFRGMKSAFPELNHISDTPKAIAKAIRRGKGRVFDRVYKTVSAAMSKHGYEAKKTRKRSTVRPVAPHEGIASCKHCGSPHTRSEHRFHGEGAFHRTHAFSFGSNPVATKRKKTKRSGRKNPLTPTLIYGKVLQIYAQKTQKHVCDDECKKFKHRYYHDFKIGPVMYGLPDGSLLITKKR